jgi:hypothetical protein
MPPCETGGCVDWLRIDGAVAELYDIAVASGFACAMALAPFSAEAASLITVAKDRARRGTQSPLVQTTMTGLKELVDLGAVRE